MSVKKIERNEQSHSSTANPACVLEELDSLNRKVQEIEKILKLFTGDKRSFFDVRFRLLKAVSERRTLLKFLEKTSIEKYLIALKKLGLDY